MLQPPEPLLLQGALFWLHALVTCVDVLGWQMLCGACWDLAGEGFAVCEDGAGFLHGNVSVIPE
jgi:hypothetical protein